MRALLRGIVTQGDLTRVVSLPLCVHRGHPTKLCASTSWNDNVRRGRPGSVRIATPADGAPPGGSSRSEGGVLL
jgi:hypothetical protein